MCFIYYTIYRFITIKTEQIRRVTSEFVNSSFGNALAVINTIVISQ